MTENRSPLTLVRYDFLKGKTHYFSYSIHDVKILKTRAFRFAFDVTKVEENPPMILCVSLA